MSPIYQFPDLIGQKANENPYMGELRPLLGRPATDVMDGVFDANFELLGIAYGSEAADCVEFFMDSRYQDQILVDVDNMPHRPDVRGLYSADLDTYVLIKINDEPLRHFLDKE